MDDSRREFHVGIMVIAAVAAIVIMVFRFGDIGQSLKSGTLIRIALPSAKGVIPQTPVQLRGIAVGRVRGIRLATGGRSVEVTARIDPGFSFPADSTATVSRSLLGDAVIEIEPGTSERTAEEGGRLAGRSSFEPAALLAGMEQRVSATLSSVEATGEQWARLAASLNRMLESSGPDGVSTLQQTSLALQQFTRTMSAAEETLSAASSLLSDPQYQQQLADTMAALPELLNDTRATLESVRSVASRMDSTMVAVNAAAEPLANQSDRLVSDLARSMQNVQSMTHDLSVVTHAMNAEEGSLRKLVTDPSLYRNLDRTAVSLSLLLQNLEPVIADLQTFSDKIARHPELLGVRGVVRGSDGVKTNAVRPAGLQRR